MFQPGFVGEIQSAQDLCASHRSQRRFDYGIEKLCPSAQSDALYGLKFFQIGQLFEPGLLTEIQHKRMESGFLGRIEFRTPI